MGTITDLYGTLSKAPVIYTLFMLKIPPEPQLESKLPVIRESLKDLYPLYEPASQKGLQIKVGSNGTNDLSTFIKQEHHFLNAEKTTGVVVTDDGVFLHTTEYVNFDDFSQKIKFVLTEMSAILNIKVYLAVGFRMIDVITPDKKGNFKAYLKPRYLPHELDIGTNHDLKWNSGDQAFKYQTAFGQLIFKCHWSSGNVKFGIPADISNIALKLNHKEQFDGKAIVILDTDHVMFDKAGKAMLLSIDTLMRQVDSMHDIASSVFLDAVTKKAINIWRGQA